MRGTSVWVLVAAAFLGTAGTAHAGYAHLEVRPGTIGDVITRFDAGLGEKPDVRVQFVDYTTALIEDRANPIVAGPPPGSVAGNVDPNTGQTRLFYENAQPCAVISTHVARCTAPSGLFLREMEITTGLLAARVRDVPGGAERPIAITSGPLSDDIELLHHEASHITDAGGNNRIRVAAGGGGLWDPTSLVRVGPGHSVIDVRNGIGDSVTCVAGNVSNWVFADALDRVNTCGHVERG